MQGQEQIKVNSAEWLFEHHLCKETKMVFHYITVNFYTKLNLQGVAYNFGQ